MTVTLGAGWPQRVIAPDPAPPDAVLERDPVTAALLNIRELLETLIAREASPIRVEAPPVDLSSLTTTLAAFGPPDAQAIGQAIASAIQLPAPPPQDTSALTALLAALEKLDFRMKGTGGGGSLSPDITDRQSRQLGHVDGTVASGATDTDNPVKIGGKYSAATPTPVTNGQRVDAWYDQFGRQNVSLFSAEYGTSVGQTSLRAMQVAQAYTVQADSVADGLASFWTSTTTGSGVSATVSGGEGTLATGAAINSSSQLTSPVVRYLPGHSAWLNSAVRFGDTGVVGNTRRIGAFTVSGTTPQDGFYYELADTTLSAVVVKAGTVVSSVAVGNWSRAAVAPFTFDANYHSFEIRWTANGVQFVIDNTVRHAFAGTTSPITATLNFPMTLQSINTTSTTNCVLAVRNIGIGRYGTPPPDVRYGLYGGAAGVSGTVNVPAGAVVRSYAAQSGTAAASITVPGITGNIVIPGDNQHSTQFQDNPDPGTLVGPCTFVFTSTAAYTITWTL